MSNFTEICFPFEDTAPVTIPVTTPVTIPVKKLLKVINGDMNSRYTKKMKA